MPHLTPKFWVRVSTWFTLFCGAGQSSAWGVCSCDAPEAAGRRTQRAVLGTGSSTSSLSFFPLPQEIFQSRALPLACTFPTCTAGESQDSSVPRSQKTMSLSTISRGRTWSPQFPGLWKDFLLFTCPHERTLVHRAQSLGPEYDCSSKEWLRVYGRPFRSQTACMAVGKKPLAVISSQCVAAFIRAVWKCDLPAHAGQHSGLQAPSSLITLALSLGKSRSRVVSLGCTRLR